MAVMGLRLAGKSNGVSELHGQTSREMFQSLWPARPGGGDAHRLHHQRRPRSHLGVVADGRPLLEVRVSGVGRRRTRRVGRDRRTSRDDELWRTASRAGRLWSASCASGCASRSRTRGMSASRRGVDRRRARPALPDHRVLAALRHLQAGHPAAVPDPTGCGASCSTSTARCSSCSPARPTRPTTWARQMIAQIVRFSRDPAVRHRIAFIEDYDISVARMLYQGSDVWLNTPRRPMEASGTSGEKAAFNGALNCSILDGWWDEMFDGNNGWAISSAEWHHRRRAPRPGGGEQPVRHPRAPDRARCSTTGGAAASPEAGWPRSRRRSRTLGPKVMASRMVRDYLRDMYEPTARAERHPGGRRLRPGPRAGGVEEAGSPAAWPEVKVVDVDRDAGQPTIDLGQRTAGRRGGPSRVAHDRRRGGRAPPRSGGGRRRDEPHARSQRLELADRVRRRRG